MKAQRDLPWSATMRSGLLRLDDVNGWRRWCAKTYGDGEDLQVIVRRVPKSGSQEQAGYYFGPVLSTIAKSLGYTDTYDLHIDLMGKFRPRVREDGSGLTGRDRWRDYDQAQRSDYVTDVITWAEADMQIRIPRPHEMEAAS